MEIYSENSLMDVARGLLHIKSKRDNQAEVFSSHLAGEFELLSLSQEAYNYYITKVKKNRDNDFYTVRKKLTRNCILGQEISSRNPDVKVIAYGNLTIFVNKAENKIIFIKNHRKLRGKVFYTKYSNIDFELKNELNEALELN